MLPQPFRFDGIPIFQNRGPDRLAQSRKLHVGSEAVFFDIFCDLLRCELVVGVGCSPEGFKYQCRERFTGPFLSARGGDESVRV